MNADERRWGQWWLALREAAQRRSFPNLLFAEQWIQSLAKARMYPRYVFTRDCLGD
jgi:hypothetical protein